MPTAAEVAFKIIGIIVVLFGSGYFLWIMYNRYQATIDKQLAQKWIDANYLGIIRGAIQHVASYDPWVSFVRKASLHVLSITYHHPHVSMPANTYFNTIGYHLANSLDTVDERIRIKIIQLLVENTNIAEFTQRIRVPVKFTVDGISLVEFSTDTLTPTASGESRNFKVDREFMENTRYIMNSFSGGDNQVKVQGVKPKAIQKRNFATEVSRY